MYVSVSHYKTYIRVRIMHKVQCGSEWKSRVIEHVGSARNSLELAVLKEKAQQRIAEMKPQLSLLDMLTSSRHTDSAGKRLTLSGSFASGLWRVVGALYDQMGLPNSLLKYLVLARIALPKSKLATVRYLKDNLRLDTSTSTIYRFMDTLKKEDIAGKLLSYAQQQSQLTTGAAISVVFYDVTTLYFETDEEDEDSVYIEATGKTKPVEDVAAEIKAIVPGLRKKGYSKDHRYDLPQVVVGLTVDGHGFPLDFQVYEGNTYEGQTLLAGIQTIQEKLQLNTANLTVVADAGMLSQTNLEKLESAGYSYIIGARLRSLTATATEQMLTWDYAKRGTLDVTIAGRRMVITYSEKRATRSRQNRERLVKKLTAKLTRGDVVRKSKYVLLETANGIVANEATHKPGKTSTKSKAPRLTGRLDETRLEQDAHFDGLKGYITNTELPANEVVCQYGNLWNVEKSFRMSKSDLRARPTFHYKRERVLAHLLICFCALGVLRVFEQKVRASSVPKIGLSTALEQLLAIREYQLKLPDGQQVMVSSELTEIQEALLGI